MHRAYSYVKNRTKQPVVILAFLVAVLISLIFSPLAMADKDISNLEIALTYNTYKITTVNGFDAISITNPVLKHSPYEYIPDDTGWITGLAGECSTQGNAEIQLSTSRGGQDIDIAQFIKDNKGKPSKELPALYMRLLSSSTKTDACYEFIEKNTGSGVKLDEESNREDDVERQRLNTTYSSVGKLLSSKLPNEQKKFTEIATKYMTELDRGVAATTLKSTPPEGCAKISGSWNCGKEAFEIFLGRCWVSAVNSIGSSPTVADKGDAVKASFSSCVSYQLYGNIKDMDAIQKRISSISYDQIQKVINEQDADTINKMVEDLLPESADLDTALTDQVPTCGSEVAGIGWMMCPLLTAATGFADTMWGIFEHLLTTQPLSSDTNDNVYKTWSGFRNIANTLLIFAFLVVIYSQITGAGIGNYGVKKMMPRIIVMAILINLSYYITQITLDLANIFGSALLSFIEGIADTKTLANLQEQGWGGLITLVLTGGLASAAAIGGIAIAGIGPVLIFIALLLLPGLLAFLAGLLTLMFRQALIPLLAILAPIAFAAYLFPNTQSLFEKWKKMFVGIVFLYPLAAVYYGGLKLAAATIASTTEWFSMLMALVILFYGTGLVLLMAIKSNAILGKAIGSIEGALNKVAAPVAKLGKGVQNSMAKEGFAKFKSQDYSGRRSPMALVGKGVQKFDSRRRDRELRTGLYNADADQKYRAGILGDPERLNGLQETVGGQGYMDKLAEEATSNAHSYLNNILVNDQKTGKKRNLTTKEKLLLGTTGSIKTGPGGSPMVDINGQEITAKDGFMRRAAIEQTGFGNLEEIEELANATASMEDPSLRKAAAATVAKSSIAQKAPWLGGKNIAEMEQGTANTTNALYRSIEEGAITAETIVNANAAVVNRLNAVAMNSPQGSKIRTTLMAAEEKIRKTPDLNKRVGDGSDHGVAISSLRSL